MEVSSYLFLLLALYTIRTILLNSQKGRFYIRMTMFIIALTFANMISISSALVLYPLGKGIWLNRILAKSMQILGPMLCGIHGEIVSGEEYLEYKKGNPTVYLINHQSTLDLLLLSYVANERAVMTAKKEVEKIPLMGQVFTAGSNILIDRGNRESAIEAMNKVGERMKKDDLSVMIFPEGLFMDQFNVVSDLFSSF